MVPEWWIYGSMHLSKTIELYINKNKLYYMQSERNSTTISGDLRKNIHYDESMYLYYKCMT